ncbi:MAG: response regulator transcription factor [Ignavibacteria bacterium]|nr:response regulator transcription factor [Ignavibacteria bacterium]MBL7991421.1 response regulator transcription factor [Candidatus Kapabacteria bacterium]
MNQQDTTLRTVIVDDDELIRKTLVLLLQEYCPDIEVVGEASSFHDAVRNIYDHKPDIVFMDVQLTDTTGFEVLDAFDANDFAVIMMSSYSQFALEAFDYDSKGYLLKPFDVEKLCTAVERARAKLRLLQEVRDYKSRLELQQKTAPTSVIIKSTRGNINTYFTEIIACSGHYGYTRIARHERPALLSIDILAEWEHWLPHNIFLRIHRSHIINIHHVAQWEHDGKEGIVRMSNSEILPVSRAQKADFIRRVEEHHPKLSQ